MAERSLGFSISTSEDFVRAMGAMSVAAEKFSKLIDKLDGKTARVNVDMKGTAEAEAGLDNVERKRKDLDGKSARVKVEIDKKQLTDTVNGLGQLARNLRTLALPAAVALITPTLFDITGALVQTSGAFGLIPAVGLAAAAAIGTVKLGTAGLSDAFKALATGDVAKFNEALAKLSPNARDFAQTVAGLKPAFDGLQLDVQNVLFLNMGATLQHLASAYIPVLHSGLTGIAGDLRLLVQNTAEYAASSSQVANVRVVLDNTRSALTLLNTVGIYAVSILMNIAAVGSDFLPGLAAGFATAAAAAAAFVQHARDSGQLAAWIQSGLTTLQQLGQVLVNVGAILVNVFTAAHTNTEGFLASLLRITAAVREWTGTLQGQAQIAQVFDTLRVAAAALMPLIGAIALAVLGMLTTLGPAIPPLVKGLTDVFNASGPLMGLWGDLAAVVLPLLGAALSALAPILGPLLFAISAITTAMKIYSITVGLVRLVTEAWAAAQVLLNVVLTANPIGLVVIALAALAAALIFAYNHSETFRNLVQAAWAGIQAAAATAWAILQAIFSGISAAMSAVSSGVSAFGQAFIDLWNNYIVPAWNGIVEAIKFAVTLILTVIFAPLLLAINYLIPGGMNGLLANIQIVWAGIQTAISVAWSAISALWTAMVTYMSGVMTAAHNTFHAMVAAVWAAIHAVITLAWSIISPIWNAIVTYLGGPMSSGFRAFLAVAQAVWNSLYQAIQAGWNLILNNVWNPLVHFITVTIPDGFRTGVAAVGRLWDGIKRALRDPLQAAINVVWNNGIVTVWNKVADLVGLGNKLSAYNLPGLATGGAIRGGTPGKDSVLIAAMPGEFVFSKPAVDAAGGVGAVDALHSALAGRTGGATALRGIAAYATAGYATGGPVGGATAQGSASTVAHGSAPAVSEISAFWDSLTGAISNLAGQIGSSPWGQQLVGFGKKTVGSITDFLKAKVQAWLATLVSAVGGGGIVAGNVGAMMAALHGPFPGLPLISGFRPGAITATGNRSYHSMGRAVDVPPRADVFNWIKATYGRNIKELIFSPMGGGQVWNGQPHMYTGITRAMHWDHVHWAMRNGGVVPARLGDRGGLLPSGTAAINMSGRLERVLDPAQTRAYDAATTAAGRRGGDGAALIVELRQQNGLLRALRGDVDQSGSFNTLIGEVRALRYQLAASGGSAAMTSQAARTASELGAWA